MLPQACWPTLARHRVATTGMDVRPELMVQITTIALSEEPSLGRLWAGLGRIAAFQHRPGTAKVRPKRNFALLQTEPAPDNSKR
jgi:hypothetical protein